MPFQPGALFLRLDVPYVNGAVVASGGDQGVAGGDAARACVHFQQDRWIVGVIGVMHPHAERRGNRQRRAVRRPCHFPYHTIAQTPHLYQPICVLSSDRFERRQRKIGVFLRVGAQEGEHDEDKKQETRHGIAFQSVVV